MDVLKTAAAARPDPGHVFVAALLIAALARLLLLGAFPLTDATEARYGEIAREMLATGNWITPQLDPGVAYWAKPPLSMWLTALSLALLGVGAFAARLPHFLLGCAVCLLVYRFARQAWDAHQGALAAVILATTPIFFASSGAVMTDMTLVLGTTLAMVGFWRSVNDGHPSCRHRYGLFVGLAIGLLAKGPVALALTLPSMGLWVILAGRTRDAIGRIPWTRGALLTAVLALPWYAVAEARTPGFLDYFIVGEHWRRFTEPGWTGDLYHYVHASRRGTIWLYALLVTLPWCLPALGVLALRWRRKEAMDGLHDPVVLYLMLWLTAPLLLFTLARNILWTYVLPSAPAFALLAAHELRAVALRRPLWIGALAVAVPAGAIAASMWLLPERLPQLSKQALVARYFEARPSPESQLLFVAKSPYSAQFYGNGHTRSVGAAELSALTSLGNNLLAVRTADLAALPALLRARTEVVARHGDYVLMRDRG